jgi:hypothetical protein
MSRIFAGNGRKIYNMYWFAIKLGCTLICGKTPLSVIFEATIWMKTYF